MGTIKNAYPTTTYCSPLTQINSLGCFSAQSTYKHHHIMCSKIRYLKCFDDAGWQIGKACHI